MESKNMEKIIAEKMSAEDVALVLSQTIKDVKERKITLRYALVVSRLALALSKTIETVELKNRIEFLEHVLKKRK
jgi:hypothetical protein